MSAGNLEPLPALCPRSGVPRYCHRRRDQGERHVPQLFSFFRPCSLSRAENHASNSRSCRGPRHCQRRRTRRARRKMQEQLHPHPQREQEQALRRPRWMPWAAPKKPSFVSWSSPQPLRSVASPFVPLSSTLSFNPLPFCPWGLKKARSFHAFGEQTTHHATRSHFAVALYRGRSWPPSARFPSRLR